MYRQVLTPALQSTEVLPPRLTVLPSLYNIMFKPFSPGSPPSKSKQHVFKSTKDRLWFLGARHLIHKVYYWLEAQEMDLKVTKKQGT